MDQSTYYRDHWVSIEAERLDAYEGLFEWRPQLAPILDGAELATGQSVVDYGCGPGSLSLELARRVGPDGRVYGFDLNDEMIARAVGRAKREAPDAPMTFSQVTDDAIPLDDASVDRVVCKNVLEYVTDVPIVLGQMRRVLRPGGKAHIIDSDWGMLNVEPLGEERFKMLFDAAKLAYRTPNIGRKLYGFMRGAGFSKVSVRVMCPADTKGFLKQVVYSMVSYARASGTLDARVLDDLLSEIESAIKEQTYQLVMPQFLVTGSVD